MRYQRFPGNAPGDFYTTGECLACALPESECPDCLAPLDGENCHTFFLKQPESAAEIERACRAAKVCCVNAIRYGGTDPAIIRRLGGTSLCCDKPILGGPDSAVDGQ